MEENINIADILKDKPYGISLYSSVFGSCVYRDNCDNCIEVVTNNCYYFNEKGHYITNGVKSENGECLLFPSNEMRDWSKFAWKKGDVLVNRDKNMHLIFEKFTDDTYTIFAGRHCYEKDFRNEYNYEIRFDSFMTEHFTLETDDADVQTYIRTIENKLGGKLNLETLEIKKQQKINISNITEMENIGIYATKDVNINDIIKDTIKKVNEGMSLICDNLVAEAEKSTNTLEEYKAYMKGAAFIFRCVAKRNDPTKYGTPSTISTIQSAIQHCIKLLPFMEDMEKTEHIKLIGWLNELLVQKGENEIKIPKQFK